LFELNPDFDNHNQTAHLVAQMIWYFIEGYSQRKKDYPACNVDEYIKFIVNFDDDTSLNFYKSPKSDRWWLEVPYLNSPDKYILVSCSYKDYEEATRGDLPDKWWKMYQKIS